MSLTPVALAVLCLLPLQAPKDRPKAELRADRQKLD